MMLDSEPGSEPAPIFEVADAHTWLLGSRALELRLSRALRPLRLTLQSWLILDALQHSAQAPGELARVLHMQKGSLSRWLTRLRDDGLVDCRYRHGDRRCKRANLTEAGHQQLMSARNCLSELFCNTDIRIRHEDRQSAAELSCLLQAVFTERGQRRSR